MEKSKTVHVVELHGKAEKLQQTLADLKKDFSGMAMPKDLEKVFTKLENSLDTILRKTSKGVIPREDFQDTEKEIGKVRTAFDSLSTSMEGVRKANDKKLLQMIPEGTTKKIEAATQAYAEYAKELASVVIAERNLETALEKKAEAEKKVTSAQNSERAYKGKVTSANKELEKHKEITEALNEQAKAIKELEDAENALDNARKTGKGEKSIANKQAKVDAAKQRKSSADEVVAGFTQKDLKAQKDAVEKAAAAEEKYAIAKKNSESAQKALTTAEVAAQTATSDLNRTKNKSAEDAQKEANALNALKNALGAVNPKYKNMAIEGKTASQQLDFLRKTIDGLTDEELVKLKTQLGKAGTNFDSFSDHLQSTRDQLSRTKEGLKAADEVATQQSAFEGRIKQFLGLSGAAEVLRRSLRNAMSTITELDATMTEMAVVTDLSVGDYWDQLPEYTARANELGVAINDAYKAATLYYQQGLKTNEVNAISAETLKMAKIAGLSAADATDKMTAALRGFNMELNETSAQRVADVYSELAAITAADTKEIANAMTKTASIASSAGMEFETTAAFLSQIIETTRESAETAGTALKTVIARFQELKKAPDEIGEVDGEIVDANAIEGALRSVGVALRDSSGQFRELDDVFLELSSKWSDLDKNTQRYIATIAAGSRQQSRFIAMMQDYGRTQELVTAANNSAGASQKQFEKTTESLEYKINQLKNAWAEFTMGIMNSDLVKTGVDILTKLLKIINKATSGFNGLAGSVTKIIGIVAVFKLGKTIFDKLRTPMVQFFADIVREAGIAGENAGRAAQEGLERSKTQNPEEKSKDDKKSIKQKVGDFVKDKTGWTDFAKAKEYSDQAKAAKNRAVKQKKHSIDIAKARREELLEEGFDKTDDEVKKVDAEIKKLQKSMRNYGHESEIINKANIKKWETIGQGVQKAGQCVIGAGVAFSAFGGILSSMGLEEAGDAFVKIGNGATIAGSAISALGPVITTVSEIAEKKGTSTAAAWGWVVAVVAAIAAITIAAVGIAKAVKEASPEHKLKQAQAAADAARESADGLTEAYQDLKNSLSSLEFAQDELENLVKGTDEWREAVEKVNDQVLQLIQQYPELAKFVEHQNGVMTIDMDDSGVQAALDEAKNKANNANIVATGAQLNVLQAQSDVNYDSLSKKAKIDYVDPETAAALASAGAYTTAMGAAGTGGGFAGAAIGTAVPVIGNVVGAVAGAAIGAAVSAITIATTGAADAAAEAAAEAAEARNDKTQSTVEGIARALASGKLIDTGSGYERAEGVTDFELYDLGVKDNFNDFYGSLGDATEDLIEFGTELNKLKEQSDAYYDSMAVQIYNAMDKTDWSEETQTIADNILDGESLEARRKSISESMENVDFLDKNLDSGLESRLTNAIQDTYGANSKLQKGENGYEIVDSAGNVQLADVTSDALRNIIATQEAKEQTNEIGEIINEVPDELTKGFGKYLNGDSAFSQEAITALLDSENGLGLTQEQQEMFGKLSEEELKEIYNSSDVLKKAFSDVDVFVDKIKKPIASAGDAFKQSAETFNKISETDVGKELENSLKNLTAQQQFGLASDNKMGAVYSKGTKEEITAFEEAMAVVMNQDNAGEIAEYLAADNLNWSNQEDLASARRKLIEQYGLEEDAADALVTSIGNAVDATSNLTVLDDVFGDFYKATKKVEDALSRVADLQWDYERLLNNGASALELSANLEQQRQAYLEAGNEALNGYQAARKQQSAVYASGVTKIAGIDLTKYVHFDPNTNSYDYSGLSELMKEKNYTADSTNGKAILEYQKELDEANKLAKDQIDVAKDSYEKLEELNETAKESYQELWDQIGEALITSMERVIETDEELLNATKEGNDRLVSKLQEQIDETRQIRENTETEEEISDMYSKAAYLGMDTSGANALALLDLEEQIKQAEQDYEDSLIDQSIQSLQDANDKAYEQRERQIAIAEQQLEIYKNSDEHQAEVQNAMTKYMDEYEAYESQYEAWQKTQDAKSLTREVFSKIYGDISEEEFNQLRNTIMTKPTFDPESTALGQIMVENGVLLGMSELQKDDFWQTMSKNTANAAYYIESLDQYSQGDSAGQQQYLLDQIMNNTSVDELVNVLWGDRISAANGREEKFSSAMGEDGFSPNIIKDEGVSGYNGNTALMGQHTALSENAYGDDDISTLQKSDSHGVSTYESIKPYLSDVNILSKGDFYKNINSGFSFNGTNFSAEGLANSLANEKKIKFGDEEVVEGSYDHYMALVNEKYTTPSYSGGQSALEIGKHAVEIELQNEAFQLMRTVIESNQFTGLGNMLDSERFKNIMDRWKHLGKTREELGDYLVKYIDKDELAGYISGLSVTDTGVWGNKAKISGLGNAKHDQVSLGEWDEASLDNRLKNLLTAAGKGKPVYYKGAVYWFENYQKTQHGMPQDYIFKLGGEIDKKNKTEALDSAYLNKLLAYKTGGLADFTGPAWLDGTPEKPEYILNAKQTERFFSLIDVLEGYDKDKETKKPSGDNYFDININVEKLENDYDVEQVADKIRRMIYDDAMYRNTNAINLIR